MLISGLVKSSLVDYPGKIAAVVFCPGCNYDCFYCHNRHLIENQEGMISIEEVLAFLDKRKKMLDGVVISGGEATLQKDLKKFILKVKDLGYEVKLDSNGSNPEIIETLLDVVDYFAIDYKAPKDKYRQFCGNVDPLKVLKTINLLAKNKKKYEVRTTICPTLTFDDVLKLVKEIPVVPLYRINNYRMPEIYKEKDLKRLKEKTIDIETLKEKIKKYQPNVC